MEISCIFQKPFILNHSCTVIRGIRYFYDARYRVEHISLEHANITVSDPKKTAAWMHLVFGWRIRWQGPALENGFTLHIGPEAHYLALYCHADLQKTPSDPLGFLGGFNPIGVCVRALAACEASVKEASCTPRDHAAYEPGLRFYFHDFDDIEYEAVSYSFE